MSRLCRLSLVLFMGLALASPALAIQQGLSAQFRQFNTHSKFPDRPFVDGDYGYGLAYEIRDTYGAWQLGALYTPDAGEDKAYDYAVSPFLNLIMKDRVFLAGIGVTKTYLPETDTTGDDWTDLYYNVLVGLEIPLGKKLAITGMAIYDFDRPSDIGKFEFQDLDFAAALTFIF